MTRLIDDRNAASIRSVVALCLLLSSVGMLGATAASAATIITEVSPTQGVVGGTTVAFGWNQTIAYNNVLISMDLATNNGSGSTVSAFLTSQIGPGTTIAEQLATQVVVVAPGSATYNLFSGLSLGPGNYFVTVDPADGVTGILGGGAPVAPTLGLGVTSLGEFTMGADIYPPAGTAAEATFGLRFNVTGEIVPEPTSIGLLATGAIFVVGVYRRRRFKPAGV